MDGAKYIAACERRVGIVILAVGIGSAACADHRKEHADGVAAICDVHRAARIDADAPDADVRARGRLKDHLENVDSQQLVEELYALPNLERGELLYGEVRRLKNEGRWKTGPCGAAEDWYRREGPTLLEDMLEREQERRRGLLRDAGDYPVIEPPGQRTL